MDSLKIQKFVFTALGYVAQFMGVISVALIALTIWGLWRSVNKERPLQTKRLIKSVIFSVASFSVFYYFSKITLDTKDWVVYGGIGLAVGYVWARTISVKRKDDEITSTNSLWYIFVWGITFGITQVFGMLKGKYLNSALFASIVSTGIVLAMNGTLFLEYKKLTEKKN